MKRLLLLFLFLIILEASFASSISIAVLDFEARGINEDEAVLITDILRTELLKTGRITLIEREKINALLKERQLQEVGVTESVELGKILGVQKIIFGRIGKLGDSYVVTVRMIDVDSGKVEFAEQYSCQITTESITKIMKEIARVVEKYLPPIEGKIALRKEDIVYITLSNKEGIKEGMELTVYRLEQVKDEEGNVVFEDLKEIGKVRVLKDSDKGSSAEIISETTKIDKGDIVRLTTEQAHPGPEKALEKPLPRSQPAVEVGTGQLKIIVENPKLLFKARIFIDDRPVPLTENILKDGVINLKNIPAGKRILRIIGPAIEDFIKEFIVKKGELTEIQVKLERAKGEVLVKTEPAGAIVVVDGREFEGKTPAVLKLPVGKHEIIVKKEGFQSKSSTIFLKPHEKKVLNITLEKSYVIFEDRGQQGTTAYKFWNITYPERFRPTIKSKDSFYILEGSEHGVDILIPKSFQKIDLSQHRELTMEFVISQVNGEHADGGFGFAIVLTNGIFILENNRDNDVTNHYQILAEYLYKKDEKLVGKQIMTKEITLWPLKTVWLARLNIKNHVLHYEFRSKNGEYSYSGTLEVKFTISDIKALGVEISYHKVTYNLYYIKISAR